MPTMNQPFKEFRYRVQRLGRSPGKWSVWLPIVDDVMQFPKEILLNKGDIVITQLRDEA